MNWYVASCLLSVARRLAGRSSQRATGDPQPTPPKMYHPKKVRLFNKPYCGWCAQAMDWLDQHGIKYEIVDVIADEKAYEEMYRLSGQTAAPVIDVDGKILADFGARELAAFWNSLNRE